MIELNDVRKVYGDSTEAVSQVSFEVAQGETATLVGPSGCGKTTMLTMINRLTELTDGEIIIDGTPISEHDKIELRRNIGYVIQEIGLFDHMTVGENIGLVPDLRGWDEQRKQERIDELLELIQLPADAKDRYPEALSGGQQQRVGVARALAAEPDIMLMDEPFGALDPITREELQDEFVEIQAGLDVTIVFVTHDINEALKMGDKVAVLNNGELVQYDSPRDLLANPKNEFVEDFVGEDRLLKRLSLISVREVMTSHELPDRTETVLHPDDSLKAALQTFYHATEPLSVIEDGTIVGSLSEADIRDVVSDSTVEGVTNV
ncbi:ABC transporter ATP-binding protein [Haloarcula sp. GH36]|uniref:ABC transporter ATP-binding protein n=1 Tax=Haloarcula montana TaxID=3111776 RepID=UPI002D77EC43|nr:ABC transporter ATP-binding protein [Haloarcula sp. GH36]